MQQALRLNFDMRHVFVMMVAAFVIASSAFAFGVHPAFADESGDVVSGEIEVNQSKINKVGKQTRGGQCLCYSYAYAQTITTGSVHSWSEYSAGGVSARWFPDLFSYKTYGTKQSTLKAVYNAVSKGKPVVLHLRMKNGGQHWVAVTGYKGANPDKLELGDFLAIDSVGTLPKGPAAIDEGTYSLYLDSNNVRISKTTGTFVAKQLKSDSSGAAEASSSDDAANDGAADQAAVTQAYADEAAAQTHASSGEGQAQVSSGDVSGSRTPDSSDDAQADGSNADADPESSQATTEGQGYLFAKCGAARPGAVTEFLAGLVA